MSEFINSHEKVILDTNPQLYAALRAKKGNLSPEMWEKVYQELVVLNDYPRLTEKLETGKSFSAEDRVIFRTHFPILAEVTLGKSITQLTHPTHIEDNAKNTTPIFFYSADAAKALADSGDADYRHFSNWSWSPFTLDGVEYHSVEQAMMHKKALLFNDAVIAAEIMAIGSGIKTPPPYNKLKTIMAKIKALGRKASNYDEAEWNAKRYDIVLRALRAKFEQNEDARKALLATGNRPLAEASGRDRIWGIGVGAVKARVTPSLNDPMNWKGSNLLGKGLMAVRDEYK